MFSIIMAMLLLSPNIRVYFEGDTLAKKLSYFVAGAQSSLDICFHQYYDEEVIDSTLSAWQRGVKIRVITEYDYSDYYGIQRLKDAGITVIDEGYGANTTAHRMHNKFIIRDYRDADTLNDVTWVGSFNASGTEMADNAIIVKSYAFSKIFETEFNQMWGDTDDTPNPAYARTGSNKYDQNYYHSITVDNVLLEVYFSPYNRVANIVLDRINYGTSQELDFMMFTFTNYDIYDAMGRRFNDGIIVYGVLEGQQVYNRNAYDYFQQHGIPVVWDNYNSGNGTYLHDKVLIVDDSVVLTGSYNFTISADTSNDESFVVIHSPEIASLYKNEFIARYEETGHVYGISEHMFARESFQKRGTLINRRDFIVLFAKIKGFAFRPDGRIIHNPYLISGAVIYRENGVWKRAIIVK